MSLGDANVGLLLVGHGTRSDVGTQQFRALADSLAHILAPLPVEPAFLELQQPDIDAAVSRLVDRGIERLVTMPLLLFAAGHAKRDIPQQVSAALTRRGQTHIEQTQLAHLGCHPALVELSSRRMEEAFKRVGWSQAAPVRHRRTGLPSEPEAVGRRSLRELVPPYSDTCLLLVGRGSHDDSATAEMHEFAQLREKDLRGIKTEVAFLAMARPLLHEQLAKLAGQDYGRVMVQPHLLFHGELVESIERQVAEMAAGHPQQEWIVTPPLADRADIVPQRGRESIAEWSLPCGETSTAIDSRPLSPIVPPLADPAGIVTTPNELIRKVILDRCHVVGIRVVALRRDD